MSDERQERILDAASQLIVRYGYDKTTVEDIAREAGVSKGAIYLHFRSKETLFEALVLRETQRTLEDMLARMDADPEAGTIFSIYQYALVASMSNPLVRALLSRDMRVMGDFLRRWRNKQFDQERYQAATVFVRQFQDAGLLRKDLTAEMLTYVLTIVRVGILMAGEFTGGVETPPIEEVSMVMADVLQRGLTPEGGGDREAGKQAFAQLAGMMRVMLGQMQPKQE
jgi:TetR/AcrR family acrAB operon transcriptional repressor